MGPYDLLSALAKVLNGLRGYIAEWAGRLGVAEIWQEIERRLSEA
jgi:hypothetical protein